MTTTTYLLTVTHTKPLPAEFTDLAAGRIYTLDCVDDVDAKLVGVLALPVKEQEGGR
jgi:hypothetical protein